MEIGGNVSSLFIIYHAGCTGTLKSGYVNYDRYLRVAVDGGKANLVSSGTSVGKYPLVLRPLTRLPGERDRAYDARRSVSKVSIHTCMLCTM